MASEIEKLFAHYERRLLGYIRRLLGDEARAREIVQEAFLRLWQQGQNRPEPLSAAWLYTVARNLALDVMRKEKRMTDMPISSEDNVRAEGPDPAQQVETQHIGRVLLNQIEQLPTEQREVVILKFQNDLSYKEISAIMGLSVSNVGYLLHTALHSLKDFIAGESL